jgi:hypothetical protein
MPPRVPYCSEILSVAGLGPASVAIWLSKKAAGYRYRRLASKSWSEVSTNGQLVRDVFYIFISVIYLYIRLASANPEEGRKHT